MTQAPERIWAFRPGPDADHGHWVSYDIGATEYTRADLVPQWQPIETAPEYDPHAKLRVIVWNRFSRCAEYVLADGDFWRARGEECSLSHWMPLPATPEVA